MSVEWWVPPAPASQAARPEVTALAAIEDGAAELEEPVARFIEGIDRAIQIRIDELRGR
jgi:hypothetical protein